jgi:hypothetical protein
MKKMLDPDLHDALTNPMRNVVTDADIQWLNTPEATPPKTLDDHITLSRVLYIFPPLTEMRATWDKRFGPRQWSKQIDWKPDPPDDSDDPRQP